MTIVKALLLWFAASCVTAFTLGFLLGGRPKGEEEYTTADKSTGLGAAGYAESA